MTGMLRKTVGASVLALALLVPSAALGDTLIHDGSMLRAANWSEGRPTLGTAVVIPPGKYATVPSPVHVGSMLVEGDIADGASIETNGSVTFTHPLSWHGTLINVGIDQLRTGGTRLGTIIDDKGILTLREPLAVRGDLDWHGTLNTEGYAVSIGGMGYPLTDSYSSYGASVVTAGEWLDYPHEPSEDVWVEQFSEHATVIVNRPTNTVLKGAGWYYGTVDLAGGEQTFAGDSFRTDVLRLDSPVITVEDGQTITTDVLTTALPHVRVQAGTILGGPGGEATIDCGGCTVPDGVELVGVKVI